MPPLSLLTLPPELRQLILSYLLPCSLTSLQTPPFTASTPLPIDFCTFEATSRLFSVGAKKRTSPALRLLQKRSQLTNLARSYGFHLASPAIMSILRTEYLDLLRRVSATLVPHCTSCLEKLLTHLRDDLGIKEVVVRDISMQVRDGNGPEDNENAFVSWYAVDHELEALRGVLRRAYGAWELVDGSYDANNVDCNSHDGKPELRLGTQRSYHVDLVKVIGRWSESSVAELHPELQSSHAEGEQNSQTEPTPWPHLVSSTSSPAPHPQTGIHLTPTTPEDFALAWHRHTTSAHAPTIQVLSRGSLISLIYYQDTNTITIERRIRRLEINDSSELDMDKSREGTSKIKARRVIEKARPVAREGYWRCSRDLMREMEQEGRDFRNVVFRDEVWVGVHIGS